MALIQVTPEQLHQSANEVRRCQTSQDENMNKIKSLMYSLNESWKGEAQEAFMVKFQKAEQAYIKLSFVLEEYANLMDKTANEFKATDNNMKSMIVNI